ncbi:hypothetical protein H4R19_002814 [Coemansia spiralis]|nr:hypothetical protein H4R19_002814 [Coemansia spiralis]
MLRQAAATATAGASATCGTQRWVRGDKAALLQLIGRLRTRVAGDWDLAEELVRRTPAHTRGPWTDAERAQLVALVHRRAAGPEPGFDWVRVGREMGRSPATCRSYYYLLRKSMPQPVIVAALPWPAVGPPGTRAWRFIQDHGDPSALDLVRAAVVAHTVDGVVTWPAVAAQLAVPLLDAVRLAAALQVRDPGAVPTRVIPAPWPAAEQHRMATFVAEHYRDQPVNWAAVAVYMGADVGSCAGVHATGEAPRTGGTIRWRGRVLWTTDHLARLTEAMTDRERFPTLQSVAQYVGDHHAASCTSRWRDMKLDAAYAQVEWPDAERAVVRRQLQSPTKAERRWQRIHALLPHRTGDQIQALISRERTRLNNAATLATRVDRPRLADSVHNQTHPDTTSTNQATVASDVGGTPTMSVDRMQATSARRNGNWSQDETARLRHALTIVAPTDPRRWPHIALVVGSRSIEQCRSKAQALDRNGSLGKRRQQ